MSTWKKLAIVAAASGSMLLVLVGYAIWQVHATSRECSILLAGDNLIPNAIGEVDHAITIRRPPHDVWPWLVQMGSGRAGWYSYDFIDNGRVHSSDRLMPEYRNASIGTIFPALPGQKDVFVVAMVEQEHSLVLSWRLPDGKYQTTWAFVLDGAQANQTRLLVRGRIASGYRPFGLPQWLAVLIARPAHFIMQRKQLVNLRARAESHN